MAMIRIEGIGLFGSSQVLTYIPSVQHVMKWGQGFIKLKEMGNVPLYQYYRAQIIEIDIVNDGYASIVELLDLFEKMELEMNSHGGSECE